MNKYLCSIFCSFYKGEKFIKGYLDNVLKQNIFNDIEFIFLDCDSPENEKTYIEPLTKKYSNIKYYRLEKDPGLYAAWNIAIKLCSSDIIGNWNIDDRKPNNGVQLLLDELINDPSLDVVYGTTFVSHVANETYEENDKSKLFKTEKPSFGLLLNHNSPHCMPLWRKRIHDIVGYFNEEYECFSDADMWLKLSLKKGKFKMLEAPIGLYYYNPKGRSSDNDRMQSNYIEAVKAKQKILYQIGQENNIKIKDIFSLNKCYTINDDYYNMINNGYSHIRNKKIVFAGLCRSVADKIRQNINYLENNIKDKVEDYKIVLFENDSSDNTKEILENIALENKNFRYISKNFDRPHFGTTKHKDRIIALAEYRTIVQKYIQNNFSDYDYVILFDTDFLDYSNDGMINSFGWMDRYSHITAMAGFSYTFKNIFGAYHIWNYDSWAYRENWWKDLDYYPYYPEIQAYPKMLYYNYWVPPIGSTPIKVNSAFGGMAIYRTTDYLMGKYGYNDCEHVEFHKSLSDKDTGFELYANPSQVMLLFE